MSLTKMTCGEGGNYNTEVLKNNVNGLIDYAAVKILPSGGSTPNFAIYPDANFIDETVKGSNILGVGWAAFPNKIGSELKPTGPDGTNASEWVNDTGYLSATINDASVAVISGGYDHVNNQIAGTICGGGHNYIQYNAEGHSFIGGGSYNWISSGRSTILAGTNNRCSGLTYNTILSGFTNKILNGNHATIISGTSNVIDITNTDSFGYVTVFGRENSVTGSSKDVTASGRLNNVLSSEGVAVVGGRGHDISSSLGVGIVGGNEVDLTTCSYSGVVGGDDITMIGSLYSASVGGRVNIQTGRSSAMIAAEESNDNGARGLFTGRKAQGMGANFQTTIGCNHPSSGVTSQSMSVAQGVTTTGSNLNAPTDQMIIVGNVGLSVISGSCYVVARNITDNKTAGYKVDFVAQWDGTNYAINGSASDLSMGVIFQDTASNITPPTLAFSGGQLRVRFGGTTSKTVNWSARIDCSVMRF